MNTRKGFTLVELLVVIAILAILATVSVVGYTSFIDRANMSNAQTEADQIKGIITNAALADDYVILVKETAAKNDGIYYVKSSKTFVKTEPTTGKGFDASADVAGLVGTGLGKLEIAKTTAEGDTLYFTRYGYKVNVMTRDAEKAPAAN